MDTPDGMGSLRQRSPVFPTCSSPGMTTVAAEVKVMAAATSPKLNEKRILLLRSDDKGGRDVVC